MAFRYSGYLSPHVILLGQMRRLWRITSMISALLAVFFFFAGVASCYSEFYFQVGSVGVAFARGAIYFSPDTVFSCWLLVLLFVTPLWLPRLMPRRQRRAGACPFCGE